MQKPRFGGAFFYINADALYAFKSRGFDGEIGVSDKIPIPITRTNRHDYEFKNSVSN